MIAADFLGDPTGTGRGRITSMPSDWATIEIDGVQHNRNNAR